MRWVHYKSIYFILGIQNKLCKTCKQRFISSFCTEVVHWVHFITDARQAQARCNHSGLVRIVPLSFTSAIKWQKKSSQAIKHQMHGCWKQHTKTSPCFARRQLSPTVPCQNQRTTACQCQRQPTDLTTPVKAASAWGSQQTSPHLLRLPVPEAANRPRHTC